MHQYSGVLKVNLSALRRNWRLMREHFSGQDCGAVVKANAYGLGVAPVVQSLFSEGCRQFFVATFDEAIQVKRLIPESVDIFVLQGVCPGMEQRFCDEDLVPVIFSVEMLRRWLSAKVGGRRRCAIKINTGMNRLGLEPEEFLALVDELSSSANIHVDVVMSHLACADEPLHELNFSQLAAFQPIVAMVRQRFPWAKISFSNSAGIFLGDEWHFDLARPGIALYGGCCTPALNGCLSTVATLQLPVIQLREISAGESVGYGGDFVAQQEMRVAVVSGGYADGLLRRLAPRFAGWCGQRLPILGRVSMDSCAFDVSQLPPEMLPQQGDLIEIIGEHLSLDDAAKAADTISYELLTRLGDRLQKVYFEEVDQASLPI
jgi:alanine racemase